MTDLMDGFDPRGGMGLRMAFQVVHDRIDGLV